MSESQSRQRDKAIRVWVTPEEKAEIEENAKMTSKSVSSFLRSLGRGYIPPSTLDKKHVLDMAKVNGDQGRLGGLLKMWLTNDERLSPEFGSKIDKLLAEIEQTQAELLRVVTDL